MRIWDISPHNLCKYHLLGEHRELHAVWIIITSGKKGYLNHPETKRWIGKLAALYQRHELEVGEMKRRDYQHNSNLDQKLATGQAVQDILITTLEEQVQILKNKPCVCFRDID